MIDLKSKRITVTGGAGFLGTHLVKELRANGAKTVFVPQHPDYDFTKIEVTDVDTTKNSDLERFVLTHVYYITQSKA